MSMQLADARALAQGLDRLVVWLRRQTPPQLSSSSLAALDRLSFEGPLRVSELARREAISQPGVTVLVNRLSESGLAERVPDPTDRRASLVRITTAGQDVLTQRRDRRAALLRTRMSQLSKDDQALLLGALPAIERLMSIEHTQP